MKLHRSERGFEYVTHDKYPNGEHVRLVSQSSAIDARTEDGFDRPGSSYLWIGNDHHLSRTQVDELIERLTAWRSTGSLRVPCDE